MCLILVAWKVHPRFALVVAANRDEFHGRPAARATFWEDAPDVLAGRDLQARGTWLGVSRNGRFAAVTNYRGGTEPGAAESRGALVTRYLAGVGVPELAERKTAYSGFNLLAADGEELWWLSNRDGDWRGSARLVRPGQPAARHAGRGGARAALSRLPGRRSCCSASPRRRSSTSATVPAARAC
jgi:uncharacterized protein with NRDE domain